jgi:hypothetical protein
LAHDPAVLKTLPRTGKRGAPQAFPHLLFMMLEREEGRHINWCSDGLSFEVPDKDIFVRETLPRYFRHSRFASFQVRAGADGAFGVTSRRWRRLDGVGGRDTSARRRGRERVYAPRDRFITTQRQLNLYGFKKSDEGELRFEHPDFLRDAPQRVTKVLRAPPQPQKPRPKKKKVVRKPPSSDDDYSDGDKTPSPKRSRCDVSALFGRDEATTAEALFSLSAPASPAGTGSVGFPSPDVTLRKATEKLQSQPPPAPPIATPSPASSFGSRTNPRAPPPSPHGFGAALACVRAASGSLDSDDAGLRDPLLRRGLSDGSDGWQRALDAGPAPPSEPLWALDTPTGGFGATFFGDESS